MFRWIRLRCQVAQEPLSVVITLLYKRGTNLLSHHLMISILKMYYPFNCVKEKGNLVKFDQK